MIVGPTVFIVSIGTGARARMDSSKNTNCSIADRPWSLELVVPPLTALYLKPDDLGGESGRGS